MSTRGIGVLGGGPGGLYAARLLRLADPSRQVTVYEQNTAEDTFGFGVALAARTQRNLESADPDTLRDILAAGRPHDMRMIVRDEVAKVEGGRVVGVARPELLRILARHAEAAGVRLRFGERVAAADIDADLVIAADGVSSQTRESLATELGATIETGRGLYLWAGADFALENAMFAPVHTEYGTFVAHAYPYSDNRSTFLIEVDEATWRRAGFEETSRTTPPDESDESALDYLSEAFAKHLDGHRLIGNRTRWLRFRTVHCARWAHGKTVLLGDAAHTAHYSIGSGTKLAMEDAIALTTALESTSDTAAALAQYQVERKPAVRRMQSLARRSQWWWESFPSRMHLPVDQLTVAYMTRAGNVSLPRFAASTPEVARAGLAQYAEVGTEQVDLSAPVAWAAEQPMNGDVNTPARLVDRSEFHVGTGEDGPASDRHSLLLLENLPADPWGAAADACVTEVERALRLGWRGVWIAATSDREELLTRLDIAERLRLAGALVVTEGPRELFEDLAAGLVSARTDLVCLPEGNPGAGRPLAPDVRR